MTGSLVAALSSSPVAPNYSVDSFSEYSTRSVNRATYSPTPAASGPRSSRAKEEDEELFRDLFAGENDSEANEETTAPTFIPQKPVTRRAPPTTGCPNPRQHLAPMKPAPPQPILTTPFIPRLKLEELVNARPNHDGEDDNNLPRQTSRRDSELEQVTEEDEFCLDDGSNEDCEGKAAPRKTQVLTHDRGFSNTLGFASNNQRSNNNELDQETLRFLEKLDLKTVLQTPRPDLLNFYPSTPTARSIAIPHSKTPWITTKQPEIRCAEKPHIREKEQVAKEKTSDPIFKEPPKSSRIDVVASRLAYMESTYGTMPIARKTRQETIDRLANPISGHSSTLQALSLKQREKRECSLTSRAPFNPISAAIAVSCRRGTTSKKGKTLTLLGGLKIPEPTTVSSKRNVVKRQDRLVHKRRSNLSTNAPANGQGPTITGLTKRESKTTLGSRSLISRKEALKTKLQSRSGVMKRGEGRKIGGSTFLTQRDDEEGIEQIENFIARNRGASQASLTFRSGRKAPSHHTMPALPTRNALPPKSRPRPPQARTEVPLARAPGTSKSTYRGRGARTSRELQSLGNLTERKNGRQKAATYRSSTLRSGRDHDPPKLFPQPSRPQAWQASSHDLNARSLTGRPTIPGGASNPLRKLKVHPAMPTLLPRAPNTPPSAATTLLMGSAPLFSLSDANDTKSVRSSHRNMKKLSTSANPSRATATTFDAPTKQSEQRKRTSTATQLNGGDKSSAARRTYIKVMKNYS